MPKLIEHGKKYPDQDSKLLAKESTLGRVVVRKVYGII